MSKENNLIIGKYGRFQYFLASFSLLFYSVLLTWMILREELYLLVQQTGIVINYLVDEHLPFLIFVAFVILFVVANRSLTYIHEYSHALAAKCNKLNAKVEMPNYNKTARCDFDKNDKMDRNAFIIIALTPLVLLSIIFIPILIYSKGIFLFFFILLFLYKIQGCSLDVLMALDALRKCKAEDQLQYTDELIFAIVKCNKKTS